MLTKLRTNPGAYDLVVLNAARCAQAVAEDLLAADRFHQGAERRRPSLRICAANANLNKDGKGYGVPWVWGMTALAMREGNAEARQLRRSRRSCLKAAWPCIDDAVTA